MQWVVTELRHKGIVLLANVTALGPEEVVSLQTYCFEKPIIDKRLGNFIYSINSIIINRKLD